MGQFGAAAVMLVVNKAKIVFKINSRTYRPNRAEDVSQGLPYGVHLVIVRNQKRAPIQEKVSRQIPRSYDSHCIGAVSVFWPRLGKVHRATAGIIGKGLFRQVCLHSSKRLQRSFASNAPHGESCLYTFAGAALWGREGRIKAPRRCRCCDIRQ